MNDPENYTYNLVCLNEENLLNCTVLENVDANNLDEVHKEVLSKIGNHNIENTVWLMYPRKK